MASKKKSKKSKKSAILPRTLKGPEVIRPLSQLHKIDKSKKVPSSSKRTKKHSLPKKLPKKPPVKNSTTENVKITEHSNLNPVAEPLPTNPPKPGKRKSLKRKISVLFAIISLLILLASTAIWSYFGAKIAMNNADQLVDPRLFENWNTFANASFPGAHTFLIKWPVFYIIKFFNFSEISFLASTIILTVTTVLGFAFIIYKINRRPVVIGTLYLAMASALLMIPATPYAGALLPVNMAMLATRNIEYLLYVFAAILIVKSRRLVSWRIILAILIMSALIASDKFFASISLFGALVAFILYFCAAQKQMVRLTLKWTFVSAISIILALSALWYINSYSVTNILDSKNNSPYAIVNNQKSLAKGLIYTGSGIMTNFGANPAFDSTTISSVGNRVTNNLKSAGALSFAINIGIALAAVISSLLLIIKSFKRQKFASSLDASTRLSVVLIWSAAVAIVAFIITDHYYPVDARYLTITFFAGFIALATYSRKFKIKSRLLITLLNLILILSISLGLIFCYKYYKNNIRALSDISDRNTAAADFINHNQVDTLVGDYWRVLPIKQASANDKLTVTPLSSCLEPRQALSSSLWQPNLNKQNFVYLLSLDKSLTDYPQCSLDQIINKYGIPDAQVLVSGTQNDPKELLLYYTKKIQANNNANDINKITDTQCDKTIMNVIAHQDDDILFMNPDLQYSIKNGDCIRTIYLTAGDDGTGNTYWVSREKGAETAYSNMLGKDQVWTQKTVALNNHEYATIATPKDNTKVSLIFLNLPDGGLHGNGFAVNQHTSLKKLFDGSIQKIDSIDKQSTYTKDELISAITKLMNIYKPDTINTQSPEDMSHEFPDHSDHLATGYFGKAAYDTYAHPNANIGYYIGYPVREKPQNVFGEELKNKIDTFVKYAQFDGAVCQSAIECQNTPTYGSYLIRQYQL